MTHILGAVIAGGAARRFGSDKAQALLNGEPLIVHAMRAVSALTDAVVVCGGQRPGVASLADRPKANMGPLGGLNAALHHAALHGFDAVLSISCDTPRLPDALVSALIGAQGPAFAANLPVVGYWPVGLAEALDAHLATADDLSIKAWARKVGAAAVGDRIVPPNVNSPEELEQLARDWC